MAEYIDIDKAIVVTDTRGRERETTVRHILDFNKGVYEAADVVSGSDFRACRNELCLRCGQYKTKHLGSCDGCRWEKI